VVWKGKVLDALVGVIRQGSQDTGVVGVVSLDVVLHRKLKETEILEGSGTEAVVIKDE
jgi:hypothetical protein